MAPAVAVPDMAADFDLVILNSWVVDRETMRDNVVNAGIKNGKIAVRSKFLSLEKGENR